MTETHRFRVLYTANLRADVARLPYVATTLHQARQNRADQTPIPTLVLDIGGAWSDESWLCRATENRAPYLLLDAMGYTLARADGLDVGGILGLRPVVQMFLMDDSIVYRWRVGAMQVNVGPRGSAPCVTWTLPNQIPSATQFYDSQAGRIVLYPLHDAIGHLVAEYPSLEIINADILPIDFTRPDASLLEMVKFVEWEARAYEQRQTGGKNRDET